MALGVGIGVGLNRRRRSLSPITVDWMNRASAVATITNDWRDAVNAVHVGIAGFRSKIKRLNLGAGPTLAASLIPQIKDWGATADTTGNGSGATPPTYSATGGWAFLGDGNNIKTGVIPSATTGFSSLDGSWGAWATLGNTIAGGNRYLMGVVTNSAINRLGIRWISASSCAAYLGSTNDLLCGASGLQYGLQSGLWSMSTIGGTPRADLYRNGVSFANDTAFSTEAKPTAEVTIGIANNTGGEYGDCSVGAYWLGLGLTQAEQETMYRVLQTYMVATGRENRIACWGDSMIAPGLSDWVNTWQANRETRRALYNGGVGGETSAQIKARFDADVAGATPHTKWNTVIWAGRNDVPTGGFDPAVTKARIDGMVSQLGHTRYRVFEVLPKNTPTEYTGQAKRLLLDQLNAALLATYGSRFVPLLATIQAAGTGTGQDAIDVANGQIPASKALDNTHLSLGLTDSGNSIVSDQLWASVSGGW